MGDAVERVIYATDAAQPASVQPFRRLSPTDLPDGASDVAIRVFRTRPPYKFGFSPGLWHALQRAVPRADLVTIHSLNLFPQYAAFTTAIRATVPYIVTPHGALSPWFASNSQLAKKITDSTWQRRMLAHAAAIHFTTQEEARLAGELTAPAPYVVIPNGVDLSRFVAPASRNGFRVRYLDGYEGEVVLFLGRIAKEKGIDLLIRGFAEVSAQRDALLVIAGPGDESLSGELVQLVNFLGLGGRVRFIGPLYGNDHVAALAAADVWALTSHTESFGNAVLEAMAAGCPVLVSSGVNLSREIERADAGVVTALSVEDIARALHFLLADPGMRARLRSTGRAFAQRFDWPTIASELLRTYRQVAVGNRRSQPDGAVWPATWQL
jgi:glycosyltransferase involved in cell wall biosynthesis